MLTIIPSLFSSARQAFQSRAALQAEILVLRHQLLVLQRSRPWPSAAFESRRRFLWVWLARFWSSCRSALVIVKPETVIAWYRQGFRLYWKGAGRSSVSLEVIDVIHKMTLANPGWGAPRIHGELLKLGFELSQATVAKYLVRQRRPPSQSLAHVSQQPHPELGLCRFLRGSHDHLPTSVCFCDSLPRSPASYSSRGDRESHFAMDAPATPGGSPVGQGTWLSPSRSRQVLRREIPRSHRQAGIREVLTAPQSPWQNPYVERLIGTIRRECLDHIIVLSETGLRRVLKLYFEYYERTRTHSSLDKDAPIPRRVQPPELGNVVELPEVGGLHHRYERRAA
jgi:putative transposase